MSTNDRKISFVNAENHLDEISKCLEGGTAEGTVDGKSRLRNLLAGEVRLSGSARWAAWILGALFLGLLVVTVTLAVRWPRSLPGQPCSSPECLTLAAEHARHQEPGAVGAAGAADACGQPRLWACGGWLQDNARRLPSRSSWSQKEELKYQELKRLRDVITTMVTPSDTDSLEWRLHALYESCMAVDFLEQDGALPLDKIISQLGGWHARRDWSAHAWSWRQALEALQARHGVTPLFAATLTWRGNDTALLLRPAGLGLPHASFYQAPSDAEAVKAYKVLLKDTALSLGASTQDAARFADDIFSFEKRLADIILGADGGLAETTMTLQSLSKTTVNLPFQSMLRAMFPLISISGRTEVVVAAPHYITYLLSVTTSTSDSILNDYFTWTLIREYLPYMSKSYQLIWREYQSHITGSTDDLSRWEFCAGLVQKTAPLATLALLQAQGEAEFSRHDGSFRATQHAAVNEIFETIKTVAVDTVTSSTVVDAETKSLMLEQLSGLNLQIGLRVHEMSPEFLRKYHKGFVVQKHDLFRNIGNALEFERELVQNAYNEKEVGIVRDNARKLISAEASYNSHTKTITFPSALAELPYFHTDYPRFVKYARAGATIGAAVADALGAAAEYNASAEVQVPPHAEPAFHCFLESLQGSVHANLSQPRAAAASLNRRVLGASLALGAARTISDDSMLPLLGDYYRDTLFALSYAQSLCSMHTPEQALLDGINFQIDGETMFEVAWPQIEGIQQALHCSIKEKCPSAL